MGKYQEGITEQLADWISRQHVFFVGTAPLAAGGHVNISPKGLDSLRVVGPNKVAYVDLTGSGAETIAHVRENGRIILMFCAFSGPPKIVRLHGRGTIVTKSSNEWHEYLKLFPDLLGTRSIVVVDITRVSDSCGYGVPLMDFVADRDVLTRWSENKGPAGLEKYRREKNGLSIDGLPALDTAEA